VAGACAAEKFTKNRVYAACSDLPALGASVHWTYDPASASLSVAFVAAPPSTGGWVAWGLNPSGGGMSGTQALIAAPTAGGAYGVQTYDITGYAVGSPGPIAYKTSDLAAEVGSDGRVQMFGKLELSNGTGEVNQVWQVGPFSSGRISMHALSTANKAATGKLNLVTGQSTAASGGGSALRKKNVSTLLLEAFKIWVGCYLFLFKFFVSFLEKFLRFPLESVCNRTQTQIVGEKKHSLHKNLSLIKFTIKL
jgi:hypothetical protein